MLQHTPRCEPCWSSGLVQSGSSSERKNYKRTYISGTSISRRQLVNNHTWKFDSRQSFEDTTRKSDYKTISIFHKRNNSAVHWRVVDICGYWSRLEITQYSALWLTWIMISSWDVHVYKSVSTSDGMWWQDILFSNFGLMAHITIVMWCTLGHEASNTEYTLWLWYGDWCNIINMPQYGTIECKSGNNSWHG